MFNLGNRYMLRERFKVEDNGLFSHALGERYMLRKNFKVEDIGLFSHTQLIGS